MTAPPAPEPLTEHHARLTPFVGTFKAEVRLWYGGGEPMVSTGTMTNEFVLGGRYLSQSYAGDPMPGHDARFEGRGFWGYNTVDARWEGFWIDGASTFMQHEQGTLADDDRTWTMSSTLTNPQTGKPMRKRSVIRLLDDDHHMVEMFFEGEDGKEFKAMEIRYERAPSPAAA